MLSVEAKKSKGVFTMLSKKLTLICLIVLYACEVFGRECSDCVFIRNCPNAKAQAKTNDEDTRNKFALARCGRVNRRYKPKVCCNDFDPITSRFNVDSEEDIENHKNIELLPKDCGTHVEDRIIGGEFAIMYEFPWMALISVRAGRIGGNRFICGGTIINAKYILTAAHCVDGKNLAGVRIGEYDRSTEEDCHGEHPNKVCEKHIQNLYIKKVITHPGYTKIPTVINDIALIRLRKSINLDDYYNAKPVCLPMTTSLKNENLTGKTATVAGWGLTETNVKSNLLRKVDVPIFSDEECREFYMNASGSNTTSTLLCAGETGKDSCKGDSGGPLMLEMEYNEQYRIVQYGIVSNGPSECGSGAPGVYTDISKYMKWILDNIEA